MNQPFEADNGSFHLKYASFACHLEKGGSILEITPDGEMTRTRYHGYPLKAVPGTAETLHLTKEEMAELIDLVNSNGFFNTADSYSATDIVDGGCNSLQIAHGGKHHLVELHHASALPVHQILQKLWELRCVKSGGGSCEVNKQLLESERMAKERCAAGDLGVCAAAVASGYIGSSEIDKVFSLPCSSDPDVCSAIGSGLMSVAGTVREGGAERPFATDVLTKARTFYEAGCRGGVYDACRGEERAAQALGEPHNWDTLIQDICAQGAPASCYRIAASITAEDLAEPLYRKACERGDGAECVKRALKDMETSDLKSAQKWYALACNETRKYPPPRLLRPWHG